MPGLSAGMSADKEEKLRTDDKSPTGKSIGAVRSLLHLSRYDDRSDQGSDQRVQRLHTAVALDFRKPPIGAAFAVECQVPARGAVLVEAQFAHVCGSFGKPDEPERGGGVDRGGAELRSERTLER